MNEKDLLSKLCEEKSDPKNQFQIKGKNAEGWVHDIAYTAFLKDWCVTNPLRGDGKEICDLLVVFGDTLLIWEIKDIIYSGNDKRFIRKSIDAPIKQLNGAERTLFERQESFDFKNAYGVKLDFDPSSIKTVFRIVASLGDAEVVLPIAVESKRGLVHVMDKSLEVILNELDTITDFIKYLNDKESLWASGKQIYTESNELDILADYILNGKSFEHLNDTDLVHYTGGLWKTITSKPEYIRKQKEDEISYAWDHIIGELHKSGGPNYLELAKELATPNRFKRRMLAQEFVDALRKSTNSKTSFRRRLEADGSVFVFLFKPIGTERKERQAELMCMCFIARDLHYPITAAVGIATEVFDPENSKRSYDVGKYQSTIWTASDRAEADRMRTELGIFATYEPHKASFIEYPDESEVSFKTKPIEDDSTDNAN